MEGMIPLIVALFGACIGSFTDVVVGRLPRQESVVYPGSHCPHCGHAIRWHDNLPVLGWLLLRGRCRDCGSGISWRYPAVELVSALLWLSALSGRPVVVCWNPGVHGPVWCWWLCCCPWCSSTLITSGCRSRCVDGAW